MTALISNIGSAFKKMIYLHKILPLIFSPLNIIIFVVFLGLLLRRYWLIYVAIFFLVLCSTPFFSSYLVRKLEGNQIHLDVEKMLPADAIVVLGGMLTSVKADQGTQFEWIDPDRFFAGVDLALAKKADYLMFIDGKLPWEKISITEGAYLREKALTYGIPGDKIFLTEPVKNTEDEARASMAFLNRLKGIGPKKIILVTSAFHMTRAKWLFEKQGFLVEAFPVDFKVGIYELTPMSFIPSAYALKDVELVSRELLGRLYSLIFCGSFESGDTRVPPPAIALKSGFLRLVVL